MKNIYIITLFFSSVFSQVSMSDINKLTNQQLDVLKEKLEANTTVSIEEIAPVEANMSSPQSITSNAATITEEDYFGYDYFRKNISFFDNIPTPADYKLGPGDEIIISLWGENNSRKNMTINKDGMIYFENIGFINLSNNSLEEAEMILTEELSRTYSTLKDKNNPTMLMLELGKLKSINVYFSGHIENPGINIVHPFSDIFSAIVQAGGVKNSGSLREVQLIRNNQILSTVDFYSFFMNGENTFSNIKLIDGDVINIPNVKNRISISGQVNRPSTYELLPNESISDIITYASGFTSDASSTLILHQIIPFNERKSDDNARTSISINFKNKELITLNNGDTIKVPSISEVDSEIEVYGRVKLPGSYPGVNTTLKNVLDIAGGFDDPLFRKTIREDEILILRMDSNQFYGEQIFVSYKDADQIILEPNDKILVYENTNYRNNYTYRFEGEVNKPGTFPINSNSITVREALALAGGLTELTSERNLIMKTEIVEVDKDGNESIGFENIKNATLDNIVGINSVITAMPVNNIVRVDGNVYNPGLITYKKGLKLQKYIEIAGGYKPDSLKRKVYIKRANGSIETKTTFFGFVDKRIYPGDTIFVPSNPDPQDFDITSFIADFSSTLANIAAILILLENRNN